MSHRLQRVCVIGSGLAGLACAVAAAARGLRVQVFDEADQRTSLPAYVDVAPNMLRDLVALGVGDECARRGFPYQGMDVLDRQGQWLVRLPSEGLAGPRFPAALGIERAELHRILECAALVGGASLQRGARVVSVGVQGDGASLALASGETAHADLVVLASGAGSGLRAELFPQAKVLEDFGQSWWYSLLPRPVDLDRPLIAVGGAGRRVVLVPVRNDIAGMALIQPAQTGVDSPCAHLREALQSFAPRVRALARHISADSAIALRPVRAGLLDLPWHHDAVLAVGDCAHALTPHFGQAAAQAIEDARVLGDLLAEAGDRAALFEAFQRRRAERVRRVHELTTTAARWDLQSESGADLKLLMEQLSRTVAHPA